MFNLEIIMIEENSNIIIDRDIMKVRKVTVEAIMEMNNLIIK